jgi:hypothetical protein
MTQRTRDETIDGLCLFVVMLILLFMTGVL